MAIGRSEMADEDLYPFWPATDARCAWLHDGAVAVAGSWAADRNSSLCRGFAASTLCHTYDVCLRWYAVIAPASPRPYCAPAGAAIVVVRFDHSLTASCPAIAFSSSTRSGLCRHLYHLFYPCA